MSTLINARAAVKNRFGAKQNILRSWPAYLGNEDGTVVSTGNKVFVRYPTATSAAVEVYNGGVPNVAGLRVMVGYRAETPTRIEALGTADIRLETQITPPSSTLGPHGDQHGWSGGDPVYINWRQITPLGVYPTDPASLLVQILQGIIPRPGTDVNVSAQTVDLTASVPATTGARYTLISYDATGTVVVTDGTINTGGFGALTLADIPATPAGNWRSAAIALYYGQTAIVETYTEIDILDLRFPEEVSAGTASAVLASTAVGYGSASNLLTGDASLLEFLASTHRLNLKGSEPGTDTLAMVATNSDTSGIAAVRAVNDLGKRISIAMYGSAYATAAYQNVGALGAYDDLLIISSGGVTSGGTNSIKFLTGGYDLATQVRMTLNSAGQLLLHALNTGGRLLQTDVSGIVAESTLVKTGAGVLTLDAAGAYTLTVPATGVAALLAVSQTFTGMNKFTRGTDITNVFIGDNAGNATVTGIKNIAIGQGALQFAETENDSVAIGWNALIESKTGFFNFALGSRALSSNVDGNVNVAIGYFALRASVHSTRNVAIGNSALSSFLGAGAVGSNIAIGDSAILNNLNGVGNIAIGTFSGLNISGDLNVFIGHASGYYETGSNKLFIDNDSRANEADGRIKALIYGGFAAAPASQQLTINGVQHINPQFTAAGVGTVLSLDAQGSGANGDGGSLLMSGQSSTTAATSMASIQWLWTDATHATRTSKIALYNVTNAGILAERFSADGPKITLTGSQHGTYTTTATGITLDTTHHWVKVTAACTITLPTAASITGREYIISATADSVVIDGDGTETIDGDTTQTLYAYETIQIKSDGANWSIV